MGIYDADILGAKQQEETARKLREGIKSPEGQMVSGWYVQPSITQYMAEALKGYNANKQGKEARARYEGLIKQKQDETSRLFGQLNPQSGVSDEKTRMAALLQGMSVNPEAFQGAAKIEEFNMLRGDRRDQRDWQERQAQIAREQNFSNQESMAKLTASLRPEQPEKLIAVMGKDGIPVMIPQSQAVGMSPFNAQTIKAQGQNEQSKQAALSAQQVLDQAAEIFNHPGRLAGTGASSFISAVPGTDAKGFKTNLDTFKAQTFLPMVQALKGMGALSDAEGKKIAESVGALDPSMKEEEFAKSLKKTTQFLFNKAKASGLNVNLPDFAIDEPPPSIDEPPPGAVRRKN